jgi:hypothetical protein
MKLFMVFALIAALLTSCCVFPEHGYITYTRGKYKQAPNTSLLVHSEGNKISMLYDHKRKQVWFECEIQNDTKDTLLFNTRHFSMYARQMELSANRYIYYPQNRPNGSVKYKQADILRLAPGATIETVLAFSSNNKITRKEYYDHVFTDSVYVVYADGKQTDTILQGISLDRSRY